jgi:hypothetical protein
LNPAHVSMFDDELLKAFYSDLNKASKYQTSLLFCFLTVMCSTPKTMVIHT